MEDLANKTKERPLGIIHVLLSQDYAIFFFAVILGIIFDRIFPTDLFNGTLYQNIGLFLIIIGSIIVYWSQKTTGGQKNNPNKTTSRDINFFYRGPYKYTRNPTNFGLTILVLGLGFVINSSFSVIFIVITYFISRFIFIKKQDLILEEKYGDTWKEYKKKVKDWV